MIWVAGRSPTLVSHSLRGVAMNLKATTLTYLAIAIIRMLIQLTLHYRPGFQGKKESTWATKNL
jgi:hypothetical protein